MRLGEAVEWALHSCAILALLPAGAVLPAERLAEFHALPAAYLARHLQQLSAAGIVEATRGRAGGYRLARTAREISLLEIVEAVEGRGTAFRCAEIRKRGPSAAGSTRFSPVCGIAAAMARADAAWRAELRVQSMGDIVAAMATDVSEEQQSRARRWLRRARRSRKERAP